MGYSFRLTARVLSYAPSHRQDSTYHSLFYTSRRALAGTRNSSMGPHHEGSIWRPITLWVNALTTELHAAPPNGAVAKSSANGLVGTGFASCKRPLSKSMATTPSCLSLTSNKIYCPTQTAHIQLSDVCPGQHAWTLNRYQKRKISRNNNIYRPSLMTVSSTTHPPKFKFILR